MVKEEQKHLKHGATEEKCSKLDWLIKLLIRKYMREQKQTEKFSGTK